MLLERARRPWARERPSTGLPDEAHRAAEELDAEVRHVACADASGESFAARSNSGSPCRWTREGVEGHGLDANGGEHQDRRSPVLHARTSVRSRLNEAIACAEAVTADSRSARFVRSVRAMARRGQRVRSSWRFLQPQEDSETKMRDARAAARWVEAGRRRLLRAAPAPRWTLTRSQLRRLERHLFEVELIDTARTRDSADEPDAYRRASSHGRGRARASLSGRRMRAESGAARPRTSRPGERALLDRARTPRPRRPDHRSRHVLRALEEAPRFREAHALLLELAGGPRGRGADRRGSTALTLRERPTQPAALLFAAIASAPPNRSADVRRSTSNRAPWRPRTGPSTLSSRRDAFTFVRVRYDALRLQPLEPSR